MPEPDAIIVGAGPAGAALAIWLAEAGQRVLLLDRARFPRDKVCGECLSPGALGLLATLGVARGLLAAGARPYRGLRLVAPDGTTLEAPYPDGALGYSLPRLVMDDLMLERARQTPGVSVSEGAGVKHLLRDAGADGPVTGVGLADGTSRRARLVVGADGRFSTVRRLAFGPDVVHQGCDRFCFVATYAGDRVPDDWLEAGLVDAGLQYLRVFQAEGLTSVCLVVDQATRDRHAVGTLAGFGRLVASQPRLARALARSEPVGPLKGMPMVPYHPRTIVTDGLALVGDAVGFMDSITGEGICRALHGSRLAADTLGVALASGAGPVPAAALAPYPLALARRFDPMLDFVQLAVRLTTLGAPLSNALVRGLALVPQAAEAFAAVQAALLPPGDLYHPWAWPFAHPGRYAAAAWPAPSPAGVALEAP